MGHYLTAHSIEVTKTQSHKDTLSPRQIQSHQNYAKQVSEPRGLANNNLFCHFPTRLKIPAELKWRRRLGGCYIYPHPLRPIWLADWFTHRTFHWLNHGYWSAKIENMFGQLLRTFQSYFQNHHTAIILQDNTDILSWYHRTIDSDILSWYHRTTDTDILSWYHRTIDSDILS